MTDVNVDDLNIRAEVVALQQMAERNGVAVARWEREAVCQMNMDRVALCLDEVAADCPLYNYPTCPRRLRREAQEKQATVRQRARERGVPERVLVKTYDHPPAYTPSIGAVIRFMASGKSLLALSGVNDCGKTSAAGWACIPPPDAAWPPHEGASTCVHCGQVVQPGRCAARPAPRGRYLKLAELNRAGAYTALQEDLSRYRLVVVDDLAAVHFGVSGQLVSLLEEVVDNAYQARSKLILATDLALLERVDARPCMADLVGQRIMSRLLDDGMWETELGDRFDVSRVEDTCR